MKTEYWLNNKRIVAGMTFAADSEPERNNMALHVCRDQEAVLANRRKLAEEVGCSLDNFVCTNQTHSANIRRVGAGERGRGSMRADTAIADTDALYTYEPGLLLCCFTADCVPVILYHEKTGLIGTIHSGWQGTVKEITPKFLERIKKQENCNLDELSVFIGASLSADRFEVDEDVSLQFSQLEYANDLISYHRERRKYHIDNQLTVKRQCELAGVNPERIFIDRTCTYEAKDCFSYREDKACGRHLSFILRKE
ncbi:peptidoglycan editing factor PgeF [Anoxybacterium hadale]|uniref:Peptidoglycan editing factor PgeF n=1 Tax=Anoxybacterium hadale TaxID=3408580 RepID=A0ACD1AFF6_9FIRM|nr:peptidoglycan editing factor PgeF [Clostridiales bacterium]